MVLSIPIIYYGRNSAGYISSTKPSKKIKIFGGKFSLISYVFGIAPVSCGTNGVAALVDGALLALI